MQRLNPVTHDQALDILQKVRFFNNFDDHEKEQIRDFHAHFFLTRAGETIIQEGGHDHSFYVLLTGKVSVHRHDAARIIAELVPGDCFGEVTFLTERPRTTSVIADTDCIVFELDRPTLNHLDIVIREKLKDNIISVLARRLDTMNATVAEMSVRGAA